jgi:RNA polymerase sigma factor (sigma-70 family)
MTSDLDLLGQFTRDHSQDAFTALVNRHVNLVYSAALRQARSPQLAEEVAQSVFTDLARNAGKLKPDTVLTAWLYQVTRRTAIDVVRRESRRQLREQIASEMNAMNATASDWTHVEPFLDEAMHTLDDTDRAAVLLRYFENKSLREVGATLGTSDDAAQKRVSRAVERLRDFFAKRGVTVGTSGLVVVIAANAVQAAPVGLVATIAAAAVLAGTAVSTSTVIATTKAIAMTTIQKTAITAALAAAVGTGVFEAHQAAQLREQNQTLQQQQAPLTEQIQQLQRERDEATSQMGALLAENRQLKSNQSTTELLKLRGDATRLAALAKENEELKMKLSELTGRWRNVINSPQFSMPYFPKDRWKIKDDRSDRTMVLLSAARAALDENESKLSELITDAKIQSLFSKQRWNDVKGVQFVNDCYTMENGEEKTVVDTILIIAMDWPPDEPGQPPALKELIHTRPEMHRWFFARSGDGWKITGGD